MNTLAQKKQNRGAAKPAVRGAPQLKVRSGAGNRHRADKFERQADELAGRMIRGEKNLARHITPRTPASVRPVGSVGQPLPMSLRTKFESSLSADLSAVRVHSGGAAINAAAEYDANAFTSGHDIYFAAGRYSPYTTAGQELLAHELIHVLQQTGQTGPEGSLRATRSSGGAGEPQLKPGPGADEVKRLGLTFDFLIAGHRNDDPVVDADLEEAIKLATADLGNTLSPTSVAADTFEGAINRAGSTHANLVDRSPRARGFFYDCLKFIDRWNTAVAILHRDHFIRTIAVIPGIQNVYTKTYGLGWLAEVTDSNSELAGVWPKKFVQSIRNYAVGPTRAVPAITLSTGFTLTEAAQYAKEDWYQNPAGLAGNELHLSAYDTLVQLDKTRIGGLADIDRDQKAYFSAEVDYNPLSVRDFIARRIVIWGKHLEEKGQPPELMRPFGTEIRLLGEKLVEFWNTVFNTTNLTFDAAVAGAEAKAPSIDPADKVLVSGLPQALQKSVDVLFKLTPDNNLPTAATYATQVKAAAAILSKFLLEKLELALPKLVDSSEGLDKALVYAWFLFRGHEFLQFIKSYDQNIDLEFEKKWDGHPDVRFAHRWRTALQLRKWIDLLQGKLPEPWATLRKTTDDIIYNIAQGHSELALLSEYEKDTGAKIDKMKEDYPNGIVEFGAIPIEEIVQLIKALYNTDLAEKIKTLLAEDATKPLDSKEELKRGPILSQAVAAVNVSSRPMRWHVKEYIFAENPEEVQGFEVETGVAFVEKSTVSSELIRAHPKSRAAALSEMGKSNYVVFPHQDAQGVFFWSFPQFWRLLATLRSDEAGLNTFLAAARFHGKTPTAAELKTAEEEIKNLENDEWVAELAKVPEWLLKLHEFTSKLLAKATTDRDVQIKLAVTHERKRLTRLVNEAMKQYTGRADETWDLPLDVLTYIENFGAWVFPAEDKAPHLAAVFLDLAPTLRKVLADERRFDIITRYYGYLVLGLIYSDTKLSELERVVPDKTERERLVGQRTDLLELRKSLDVVRLEVQKRFGFEGVAGKSLKSFVYTSTIDPNVAFKIDGVQYKLVKVHQTFKYNPAYGQEPGPYDSPGEGGYRPPMLNDKVYGEEYKPTGRKLFTVLIDGHRFDITDKDTERLDQFSNVIEMRANVLGLEATAAAIEGFAELALDLAELVPGVGQGIMAARMTATVIQFLASGEFEDMKRLLTNEPFELVTRLFSELQEMFTPDKAWDFLLFGSAWVDGLLARQQTTGRNRRAAVSAGRDSVFRKIMAGVRAIRKGVGKAFRRLHDHIQLPVDNLQASVLARPRLAWALGLIGDQIHHLPELVSGLKAASQWTEFVEGFSIDDAETALQKRIQEILDGLAHFQLPEKVVPFAQVISAIIDLILGRLGTKGKAVRIVMDSTGLTDELSALIAAELEGTAADPNKPWKEQVLPLFSSKFYEMQTALVDAIYNLLTGPPLDLKLVRPEAKQVDFEVSGEGFEPDEEDLEAAPFEGGEPDPRLIASLPPTRGGTQLPSDLRMPAQTAYGHDFSHVRLHTGSDARPVTQAFGAEGVTSGSHVYLRPGLSPRSGAGNRVLRHELAHVLQQTGPRPLGQRHSSAVVPGGRSGLRWTENLEHEADHMAAKTGAVQRDGPVPVLRTGLGEWQPSIVSIQTVRKLLRKLADFETIKEAQQEIDKRAAGATSPDIEDEEATKARGIWQSIWDKLKAGFATPTAKFFPSVPELKPVSTELKDHMASHIAATGKAIPWIAAGTQKVTRKKNADKSVTETKTLKPGAFVKQLESYVLAKTGVALLISADDDKGTISDVRINNLVIIMVGGGAGLWEKALTNAGVTGDTTDMRGALRALLRPAGVRTQISTTDAAGAPKTVPIWATGKFAFHADLIQLAREHIQAAAIKGRPDDVPQYKKYVEVKDPTAGPAIGMRLGRYGDKNQEGPDRDSHHTTQWLLIEYFRNQTEAPLIPFAKKEVPGWKAAGIGFEGSFATGFENPADATQSVRFKELDKGSRGEAMPALLIARKTHHEGDLHIKGATPEDFVGNKPTQGGAVHDVFQKALFKGEFADWKGASDFNTKVQGEPAKFASQLYKALQATYADMYRKMEPALEKSLTSIELTYYLEIAAKHHTLQKGQPDEHLDPDYDPPASAFGNIATLAKQNNDTIMKANGWQEPY